MAIWKFDTSDKIKRKFFQAMSVQLHVRTNLDFNETSGEKANGKFTRMLRAVLDKSWKQHPTKQ